ncbi:hypothetical protein AYO40_01930 [Planctomycetaceae bacterium SCGC AG-212-D15]|nr:hypothetical protein AYO40_01930 [Planctomycetaceae bacterium SCGC AG-212-D15]
MSIATHIFAGIPRPTRHLPGGAALPHSSCATRAVPVAGVNREIAVEIAAARHDWEEAFHLVAGNYQQRRYETGGTCDLRFTSYHALPNTMVTIAKEHGRVLATMSVFVDNTLLGLPMDDLYAAELRPLRAAGRRICEAGCLASRDLSLREFVAVFEALIRLVWQHHVAEGGDTVVITCNPRHRSYYTRVLGCEPMGSLRNYAAVENHPAEAFVLHIDRLRQYSPAMYRKIFGQALSPAVLAPPRMPADLARYFAHHSARADVRLVEDVLRHTQTHGSPRRW